MRNPFRKRFYVGVVRLNIVATRFPWPPLKLDWQGCFGPLDSHLEASTLVYRITASERGETDGQP